MTRLARFTPRPAHAHGPQLTAHIALAGPLEIFSVAIEGTQATVQLEGEVDVVTADLLSAALDEQLAQGRRSVRLDLSRLTFLDCAGLRALTLAHNRFLSAGGTLVLTGVGHRIARLLRITHLDEALFVAEEVVDPPPVRHLTSVPTGEPR